MLKMKWLALLVCALLIPAAALAQPNPDFRAGTEAFYQGDMKAAVANWNKALEDPKLTPANQGLAHMNLSLAYMQLGEVQSAEQHLDKAIQIDPKQPMYYSVKGDIYAMQGKLDPAVSQYGKAIKLQADYFPARLNRGIALTKMKQYKDALKDFDKAVELGEVPFQVYNSRGNCYEEMGKLTQAVSDFSKAIIANPKYPSPYFNRSRAYEKMGYISKAIEDSQKFAELEPEHPWAKKRIDQLKDKLAKIKKGKKAK